MTQLNQIYKCSVCGNIVELVHVGGGTLVCCGKEMILQEENSVDAAVEKHVPIIENRPEADQPGAGTAKGVKIKVGSAPHPMEEAHFIEWIEILVDGKVDRQYLKPGDASEAEFNIDGDDLVARSYCNLHGLWKSN